MKGSRPSSIVPLDEHRDSPATPLQEVDDTPGNLLPTDFPADILDELTPDAIVMLEEYYLLKKLETVNRMYALLRLHPVSTELKLCHISLNAAVFAKLAALTEDSATWGEIAATCGLSRAMVMAHAKAMREKIGQWQ